MAMVDTRATLDEAEALDVLGLLAERAEHDPEALAAVAILTRYVASHTPGNYLRALAACAALAADDPAHLPPFGTAAVVMRQHVALWARALADE